MFHVKQPNRHKLSEDAICCSTEAYSAAGKNHLHQQAKNKKNMSSSLVFLNLQSPITCGALNKLHHSAFFLGVSRETIGLL